MPPSFEDLDPANAMDRVMFDVQGFADEGGFRLEAANWFTTVNATVGGDVPMGEASRLGGALTTVLGLVGAVGLALSF